MDKKILSLDQTIPLKTAEDILALSHAYSLSRLSYINIAQQEQLASMVKRWPLLAELAQLPPEIRTNQD
ncbi:cellulose biosynthesis protein BcsR [Legionella maioricensis]|uniref:YhjR family protein n=1 Tax=Legionella maioricensis TaxID=2896528 RepID=A0A9X2D2X0_9GAMM|nr:cellulose biosynthesis protein BcsR [Legionella maioricensis]MCL9685456.1 YhjR family protein [Legionella maioricensis]MCL9689196.1 YhjR family protein [Legionella maioricensis]